MTTTSTCRPRRPRDESSLRVDLARRAIYLKLHKPSSSKEPAKPSPKQLDDTKCSLGRRIRFLDLNPDELICAQAIFDKLPTIRHVRHSSPRLYHRELVYPNCRFWKLEGPGLDVVGQEHHLGPLSVERIRTLLSNLLIVIDKLYNAHIAYTPDIRTLRVRKPRDESLWPFVETFDFSKRVDDQTVPWEYLKKKTVKFIKGQFSIVKQLAKLRDSQPLPRVLKFHPDRVAEVLTWYDVRVPQRYFIIRQVYRYSQRFGDFVNKQARQVIGARRTRTGPADESVNEQVRDCLCAVSYVIGLLDQCSNDKKREREDLRIRAESRMVYTALLIHLHAKIILVDSNGILRFNDLVADAYTSYEGFQSVVNAYSRLRDAIRRLEEQGDYITSWHTYYRRHTREFNGSNHHRLLLMEQCCMEKTGIILRKRWDACGSEDIGVECK
ncbi:hypothetical protein F4860DRAFT_529672 [Xylaria cubensis]|nr:hypothetical protein F4860DRAFT_529672 [Xylaria cubensis]